MTAALPLWLVLLAAAPTTAPATRPLFDHPTTRPAALLVEAFDALKMDDFDATRAGDLQAYQAAYYAEWDRRQAEQAAIAKLVIDFYPDSPRLADLVQERLNWLGWVDEKGPQKVLDEIAALRARGIGADETKQTAWVLAVFEGGSLLRLDPPHMDEAEKVAIRLAGLTAAGPDDLAPPLLSHVAGTRRDAGDAAGETRLLDEIVRRFPDSAYGQVIVNKRERDALIGKPFGFAFTDFATGEKVDTRDWKGGPVVIDFWATWCGPCIADLPGMIEAYRTYSPRGVRFVGVSFDEPRDKGGDAALRRFLANQNIPWPQYYLLGDPAQRPTTPPAGQVDNGAWDTPLVKGAKVGGIPSVFVLDADGNLRCVTRGEDVAAELKTLLGE